MPTIKVNPLDQRDIAEAITQLKMYREALAKFPILFTKELMKQFDEILQGQAPPSLNGMWKAYAIDNGDGTARGIAEFDGRVEFVEFGTGIVGEKNHAGINEEWLNHLPPPYTAYNRGPTITHFEDSDMDYWVYVDETGKHVTHGVPANPFIYRSVTELMHMYGKIAKDVFIERNISQNYID